MLPPRPALAVALLLGGGCSSGGSGAPPSGIHSVADLGSGITAAFCAWQFRCCSAIEITAVEGNAYATEAACASSSVALSVRDQLSLAADAVTNGLMVIDPMAAASCLATYQQRACNPLPQPRIFAPTVPPAHPDAAAIVAACPGVFVGQIPVGLRCDMTAECVNGAHCVTSSAVGGASPDAGAGSSQAPLGVCEPYQEVGDPCNTSDDCDPIANLVCRGLDATCAKPAALGEPCAPAPTFGAAPTIPCDETKGLFCDSTTLVCVRPPGENQPCRAGQFASPAPGCDPDPTLSLMCVGLQFDGIGTCARAGQSGDACGGTALALCQPGLACNPTQPDGIGTCGAPPAVGAGCASGGVCSGIAACDPSTFLCTRPGATPLGQPCASNAECASMACALSGLSSTSVCVPPPLTAVCAGNGATPSGIPGSGLDGGTFEGGAIVDAGSGGLDAGIGGLD